MSVMTGGRRVFLDGSGVRVTREDFLKEVDFERDLGRKKEIAAFGEGTAGFRALQVGSPGGLCRVEWM